MASTAAAGIRAAISGSRIGRGAARAAGRVRTSASGARAGIAARGNRLAGATLGSRTKALGTFGAGLTGLLMYDLYETIVSPMEKMGSCSTDPFNTENGDPILGFINSDCSSFIIPGIILFLTLGVILFIITRDKHEKAWGASLGPKENNNGLNNNGLNKELLPKTGGGKKLMNVNILLVIFIGYLLFYLYERYSEMINKEKELNKFKRN